MNILTFLSCLFVLKAAAQTVYKPSWTSLDVRPLPSWFDEAKIGISLYWGVYSVPSFHDQSFWYQLTAKRNSVEAYMSRYYPKNFLYPEFAKDFTAEFFDPEEWADIFNKSGAKYVVMTSKHHEGYTMWPSKYSHNWNVKDVGPGRDLLGEVANAVRRKNLYFGVNHALLEWFHPLYKEDKNSNFSTRDFAEKKLIPEMVELIEKYKPSILWSNGYWDERDATDTYWGSTKFLAWLYNESPVKDVVVTNDRWGRGTLCKHGGFLTCNTGVLQKRKWENSMPIDKRSSGFRRTARLDDYHTTHELISILASTVSCGGNIVFNIGPTKDGIIAPIFQHSLKSLGQWLEINGEAIYGTKPWSVQNDTLTSGVWYTAKNVTVYAIVLFWPFGNVLKVGSIVPLFKNDKMEVSMLGTQGTLKWNSSTTEARIIFPDKSTVMSEDAYVLKIREKCICPGCPEN